MVDTAQLRLQVIQHACSVKCMGHAGNNGGCCKLGERDWIMGPVPDARELLARLSLRWGRPVPREEVVIDFEEGRRLYPERSTWQNPAHYPALRSSPEGAHACHFHDDRVGCTIHDIRPQLCRDYSCSWLQETVDSLF